MIRGMTSSSPAPRPTRGLLAHAVLLGERLRTAGLDHDGVVATTPLAYRMGQGGLVVLFRYGAAVLFGLAAAEEAAALQALAERLVGPESLPEEETATLVLEPDADEQITSAGAIQLRQASTEHLLIVADVLAKSVALGRDERQVAAVFDAIEPYAAGLAATGRPPGGRGPILRLIGQALLVQHRVSGRVAVREKPDILWDRPDLERLYGRLEDEYELIERAETLDRKLAVIAGATTALIDLKDAARTLRLELIIILLILAELVVGLVQLLARRP
jgi:uncharacterized Rmd1/YagE family protein